MKLYCQILVLAAAGLSANLQAGGNAGDGKIIASEKCQACHNTDGNSTDPQFPRLAGQHADYLERSLLDYQSGARSNPIMLGFASGLSKQDIADVAAWFASQTGITTPVEARTVSK